MKFSSVVFAAGLAAVASAQSITGLVAQIPTCAIPCFTKNVPSVCSGGVTDYGCQCMPANKAKLTTILTPCILGACSTTQALMVQKITNEICSAYSAMNSGGSSTTSSGGSPAMTPPSNMTSTPVASMPTTPTAPTGFNAAPMATAGPLGAAIAAAIAFAL